MRRSISRDRQNTSSKRKSKSAQALFSFMAGSQILYNERGMNKLYLIGGANIDISGQILNEVFLHESNLGKISYSYGGVARNVAENAARLKAVVCFQTVFGNDAFARELRSSLQKLGIDISFCKSSAKNGSSIYLSVMDVKHDLLVGLSDMDVLTELKKEDIDAFLGCMDKDDILFVDTNLEEKTISYILEKAPCFVACDPISSVKALKAAPYLNRIQCFKPNAYEAKTLSGIEIKDENSAKEALAFFAEKGMEEILISMGENGLVCAIGEEMYWVKVPLVKPVSATGAGENYLL